MSSMSDLAIDVSRHHAGQLRQSETATLRATLARMDAVELLAPGAWDSDAMGPMGSE